MNNLISINSDNNKQPVSARELHEFLESKQDFTTWIKSRIEKYEFIENVDFTLHKFMEGKVWKHEYSISIGMAKELSMVENNDKGSQARKYFISIETKFKELSQPQLSKELQAIFMLDKMTMEVKGRVEKIGSRIDSLENDMPLFNVECKELQSLVRKVVTRVLGGYRSTVYNNKSIRTKVYSDIQQQIRREFGIERYEAIKRCQLDTANEIVNSYKAPLVLVSEITLANNQIGFN